MFVILSFSLKAQSIDVLQKEIKDAENVIRMTTEQLNSNKITQENRREKLLLINNNLKMRKELINKLNSEIILYSKDIKVTSNEIEALSNDIDGLQSQYSKIVVETYRQLKQNSYLKFILSADSFHEIFRRLHYLRLHSNISHTVVTELTEKSATLSLKTEQLNQKKSVVNKSLNSKKDEASKLSNEQNQFNSELNKLKSEEKNLSSVIRKNQALISKLQDEIKRIIEEEASKHRGEKDEKKILINEKLSTKFAENKGKLPNPMAGGVVIEKFGSHPHPLQKGIIVNNKGVNISVVGSAKVCSIFDGVVTKIFFFSGLGNNVMVRHGNYISVYSNLSKVTVKVGDKVKTLEQIGEIVPTSNSSSSALHFELWNETTPQNPELWLK